jgi:hypothetical protein
MAASAVLLLVAAAAAIAAAAPRMNVLMIVRFEPGWSDPFASLFFFPPTTQSIDDLRPELGVRVESCAVQMIINIAFLGCEQAYGYSHMHTPNIDRLANMSMLFQRAYVQVALWSVP